MPGGLPHRIQQTEAPEETTAQENADAAQEDSEQADASAEGRTFTVGFDAEFPPYGYMDENGEYTGFDLELAAGGMQPQTWMDTCKAAD